jgi:putative DNA methylase
VQPYRKKLIEVALPLAKINEAAAREKSIRHGHPSTLHLWWARRPLAACRAVLFASLVDDPDSDPAFRRLDGSVDEERAGAKRAELFNLIEELVKWENSNNPRVINQVRAEIARCVASRKVETGELKKDQPLALAAVAGRVTPWDFVTRGAAPEAVNAFLAEHAPPVLDPFCGGGSIPLEAQRLGLRAYASDLNPVPVLITKALIEIPPTFAGRPPVNPEWQKRPAAEKAMAVWEGAKGLAEDVRYYGKWMRDEAEKCIGHLYPKVKVTEEMARERPDLKEYVGEELTVIAWLWARTVASPDPAAKGAHVPLVRSFWLGMKRGKEAWVYPVVDRTSDTYAFEVWVGQPPSDFDPKKGTIERTGARCLLTQSPIPFDHIRAEGRAGRLKARLLAIAAEGRNGRVYLNPSSAQVTVAESASPTDYPSTDLPEQALGFRVMGYGIDKHYKLFTPRQLVALTTFSDLVREARERVRRDAVAAFARTRGSASGDSGSGERSTEDGRPLAEGGVGPAGYADAVVSYCGLAVDRSADFWCSLCTWANQPKNELVAHTFTKQALSMVWDFAEANPFSTSGGNFEKNLEFVVKTLLASPPATIGGMAKQLDATTAVNGLAQPLVSTDPPYYDNIAYAELSDFFYIWLRRSLGAVYPQLFATLLTPKKQELIASPYRHEGSKEKAQAFFEAGLGMVFERMRQAQAVECPLTVYYAFKQAETEDDDTDDDAPDAATVSTGWETMLAGLIRAGFSITGTWPTRSERPTRTRSIGSNALASSIVLVCRPRPLNAPHATRREFIAALRQELPEALRNLQRSYIAPVDLAQAAIGPGMAVFTRFSKVMEPGGEPMTVRTALGLINQALDEVLAEQEGEFDGDTRWALAWFEQYGTEEGPFGVAETLSKAKNTAVNALAEAGVITARGGKVRLVRRADLPADWSPTAGGRLTVWEATQHLIRALESQGEAAAAALLHRLGGLAETCRDLAYRLYTLCERKKWAEEALAYNGLVIAWPELTRLALAEQARPAEPQQGEMFS